MKNSEEREIEKRLKKLEKDSHPPVDWQELIFVNVQRIEELEDIKEQLMYIIKNITTEKKELKERIEILEKVVTELTQE
jgi:chromosome segregation ATPase